MTAMLTAPELCRNMFAVKSTVRQRTRLFPTNESEEAVEAVLRSLRSANGAARDILLAGDPASPTLPDLAEDIATAAKGVTERWHLLDRGSPYRTVALEEAVSLLTDLIEVAEVAGVRAVSVLGLDADLAALVAAQARAILSDQLHAARGTRSMRSLANDLQLSLGYLSDLEAGRAGPPSAAVCEKLASALAIDLSEVEQAKMRADELKRAHRERTATLRRRSAPGGTVPREDARLRAIAVAAAEDAQLLDLIDVVIRLPTRARRGLLLFLGNLKSESGSNPGQSRSRADSSA